MFRIQPFTISEVLVYSSAFGTGFTMTVVWRPWSCPVWVYKIELPLKNVILLHASVSRLSFLVLKTWCWLQPWKENIKFQETVTYSNSGQSWWSLLGWLKHTQSNPDLIHRVYCIIEGSGPFSVDIFALYFNIWLIICLSTQDNKVAGFQHNFILIHTTAYDSVILGCLGIWSIFITRSLLLLSVTFGFRPFGL